jgi:hypothetical protein
MRLRQRLQTDNSNRMHHIITNDLQFIIVTSSTNAISVQRKLVVKLNKIAWTVLDTKGDNSNALSQHASAHVQNAHQSNVYIRDNH